MPRAINLLVSDEILYDHAVAIELCTRLLACLEGGGEVGLFTINGENDDDLLCVGAESIIGREMLIETLRSLRQLHRRGER